MPDREIATGVTLRYPYLWVREAKRGETSGRKARPCVVAVRLPRPAGDLLILFAITSKQPEPGREAVEIPRTEKIRGGLYADMRLWIMLDEFNEDILGRSFHLTPDPPLGRFSNAFFLPVMRAFIARRRSASGVNRR
ncbi:MAG TPA: hypothetical protein PKE65_04430 [Rhizobiaceae bacterium]|nr:hypothetical protein [Rhizobiaceae bacterium]